MIRSNLLILALATTLTRASGSECTNAPSFYQTSVVPSYEMPDRPLSAELLRDSRCTIVLTASGLMCRMRLMGVLHEPVAFWEGGRRPKFPVIVYNHGSGLTKTIEEDQCDVANFFVPRGYAVFFPFRRGNGLAKAGDKTQRDPDRSSTGRNILDAKAMFPNPLLFTMCTDLPCFTREALMAESADVVEAVKWIRKRNFMDPDAIAIMGNSYGGMMTVLTNTRGADVPHQASVVFSPGGQSWHEDTISKMLTDAVLDAKAPALYLQAKCDYDTRSVVELSRVHAFGGDRVDDQHGRRFMAAIFAYPEPLVRDEEAYDLAPCPSDSQSVHVGFAHATEIWGDTVLAFLKRYRVR